MRAAFHFLGRVVLIAVVLAVGGTIVSAQTGEYIVGVGDDLVSIAQSFGVTVDCLTSVNYIAAGNVIYVGQRLDIASCQTGQDIVSTLPVVTPATYTVRSGDSLTDVATTYGLDLTCLAQANGINNPNAIRAGQVLDLAICAGQTSGTSDSSGTSDISAPVLASTYTVRGGDRLGDIAQLFGVELTCLVRVNALVNQDRLTVGQVLQIDPCIPQDGGIAPLPQAQNYTVQRGDRLNNIAAVFGLDADCLARTNYLANPNYLRPGETLVLNFSECAVTSG